MKPTVTNCFDCWIDDKLSTPATFVFGDEFFCDAHLRKADIETDQAVPIGLWLANQEKRKQDPVPTSTKETTTMAQATPDPEERQCAIQGCGKRLIARNRSGYCTRHFYQSKSASSATRKPGRAKKSNIRVTRTENPPVEQTASLTLTREQLVALFTSWPIERQVAAVQAVFVQELSLA